jgi:hypothetical protein
MSLGFKGKGLFGLPSSSPSPSSSPCPCPLRLRDVVEPRAEATNTSERFRNAQEWCEVHAWS